MGSRGFLFDCVFRVLLISAAFVVGFGWNARAQQTTGAPAAQAAPATQGASQSAPASGSFLERFVGNFFNGSQDIPNSPWPYNSGPPSDLRKYPAPQTRRPFPYGEYQIGARPRSATATSRPPIR